MKKYTIKYAISSDTEMHKTIVSNCINKHEAIGKLMMYKKLYIKVYDVTEYVEKPFPSDEEIDKMNVDDIFNNFSDIFGRGK